MRIYMAMAAGLACGIGGMAAAGEVKIYPYASGANYCPTGLQPVSINGVICCGTPNVSMSYQQAKAHPVAKKRRHVKRHAPRRASARPSCTIGTKGCTFD